MSRVRRLTALLLAVLVPTTGAAQTVLIQADRLGPAALQTTVEQRVTFVNRSGRIAHIDFGGDGAEHHVFQVPGSIWAIFHRVGRHAYVVHFESGRRGSLQGQVDVAEGPRDEGPQTCTSVTVMDVCIEP